MSVASIILCAGVGTRMNSSRSKMVHEICGRPLGYWSIKNALETTSLKPIVVLSHLAKDVEAVFRSHFHDSIQFVYQESPNGTGGAVRAAMEALDENCSSVLVLYGDTPLLRKESLLKLINLQEMGHAPLALFTAQAPKPTGYGRIVRNESHELCAIVEEYAASCEEKKINEVNVGVYVFSYDFLHKNIGAVKNNNIKGEYCLTDLVALSIKNNPQNAPIESIEIPFEEMHGVNDRIQLAFAQQVLNRRLLEYWMHKGVTFIDAHTTYVEDSVSFAKDVIVYPGVHLRGETHVGEQVIIENGCVVKDTLIEAHAHLYPYTCCEQAYVGESVELGPFARLRPEARLEKNVKVGNFVEIKRSRLKQGVKAGHLSYIGDADIGENCNIGAGSITCNYDGKDKHRTVIGNKSFIGSNTTLIAPLAIGENSYIAGGSTINREVPRNSLAIARNPQVIKARKKKQDS
ncbi:MAG: bifunctional UDP-N-acetylglucosamine diphosphorylase/glucosamine-1-phosphate N-acetyltransferase GlmU [Myxococcales bacterium]|nr:bifunctional UDP-N-acetylglucosamine diphosphorylase/glucosamine-1-phosphate N-acetyltransferase GlmU [Myxococcales bacterium]USN50100.1 MAG: bifunctional UDP-N-acetylglucosamine diphosphorylase/glucosamine-1-phosphate N-acetyltransferase GlmU [Myxococcales bacterium]